VTLRPDRRRKVVLSLDGRHRLPANDHAILPDRPMTIPLRTLATAHLIRAAADGTIDHVHAIEARLEISL
jgi:hypothetical protein